ncbi:MAG: ATP-dependent helicase HrpB, partial [Nitriliruptoraceae bacterium]|nr:ATP-dependent helicase HrpB [Nitriliruptoraceae bacterium]
AGSARRSDRGSREGGGASDRDADLESGLVGGLVLDAWPERLAQARPQQRGRYLLATGRGASVPEADLLAGEPWLAVAHLDRGQGEARLHLAAAVDEATVRARLAERVTATTEVAWRDGEVVSERRHHLGAIVLDRVEVEPDPEALHAALLDAIGAQGVGLLLWRDEDRALQARLGLLHGLDPDRWPDVSDAALQRDAPQRIGPFLHGVRRARGLAQVRASDVLAAAIPAGRHAEVERLVPTHLPVPSGSRIRLDYAAGDRPVLAVRVQELFGLRTTPSIADGRVPVLVHLLSPAHRPVQVTDDLAGFWERTYPQVRAELRGRYPKHAWPEDPTTARAVRGTGRRRR